MSEGRGPTSTPSERATKNAEPERAASEQVETLAIASSPGTVRGIRWGLSHGSFDERYSFQKKLGSGGMGHVQLVTDLQTGRDVALKVSRSDPGGSHGGQLRFVREARVQAQLEHPAIVPVYDMGLTPDGVEFFTMKRIGGRTLKDIIADLAAGDEQTQRQHPRNELLGAFRQACLAIEYAHQRGVLHRDIKPDNLMLGELGEVYVLDWGLAKIREIEDGGDQEEEVGSSRPSVRAVPQGRSADGSVLGTPGYMPPEQAAGNPDIDETADVFSLGAVLFELLTLEPLVHGERNMELILETIRGPREVEDRLRERDVPPELVELVLEATAADPAERMVSARQLADGIQRFLDGDRDAEARVRMAAEHAERAEQAAERAFSGEDDATEQRQRALQEAGRALALDPSSTRAAAALMRMLVEPPDQTPAEVDEAVEREETEEARASAKQGAGMYLANGSVAVVAGLVLGFHDAWWIVPILVPQIVAALLCWTIARRSAITSMQVVTVGIAGFTAIAADAGIAGPLILVPGYVGAQVVVLSLARSYRHRHLLLGMGVAAVLVPVGLEYSGWIQPAYEFIEGGGLVVHPRFVELPPLALPLGAAAAIATSVIGPAVVVWSQLAKLRETRRRMHLQSWMLRQLVPGEARASATPPEQ